MRKLLFCVLMMSLLLTACGGEEENRAEELALTVRGEYLAAQSCAGTAALTADYGQRICRYEVEFASDEEETVLTLTAPETVAGITARLLAKEGSLLEYDGAILETGELDGEGLTPVSAIPAILERVREGFLDSCVLEEEEGQPARLRLCIRDPEQELGHGVETTLWFDPDSRKLLRGEISRDGFCVIQCEFTSFETATSGEVT